MTKAARIGSVALAVGFTLAASWSPVAPAGAVGAQCHGRAATIVGSPDADDLTGTTGDDVIVGFGGSDTIDGGAGDDVICGNTGNDVLRGGRGSDEVYGGASLTIRGAIDREIVSGGPGDDVLDVGPSTKYLQDLVSFADETGPVTVDLRTGTSSGPSSDTIVRRRDHGVLGSPYGDTMIGRARHDLLVGGDGPDVLLGRGGPDDLYDGDHQNNRDVDDGAPDLLVGGPGPDIMVGSLGANTLRGGSGGDGIYDLGTGTASGGDGNDFVAGWVTGNGGRRMIGGVGHDRLRFWWLPRWARAPHPLAVDLDRGFARWNGRQMVVRGFEQFAIQETWYDFENGDRTLPSTITTVTVHGSNRDELFEARSDVPLAAWMGGGDDFVYGSDLDDLIVGGRGEDGAYAGRGRDVCRSVEQRDSCRHRR
ncbi:MAG: hypothetical protein U0R80_09210 [Nocardioidaceae bacterium]